MALAPVHAFLSLGQLADVSTIVAAVASPVAIAALWYQLKQQADDGKVALITGMTTLITDVGRAFIDYPEMRRYFYDDVPPDNDNAARAQAIAVALAGAMDHAAAHFDSKMMEPVTRAAWLQYFRDIYTRSPVLRQHLDERKGWYDPRFIEALEAVAPQTAEALA